MIENDKEHKTSDARIKNMLTIVLDNIENGTKKYIKDVLTKTVTGSSRHKKNFLTCPSFPEQRIIFC